MAYTGIGMAALDVAGHLWNGRKLRALKADVDASVADARERGERIEARAQLLMDAMGVRIEEPEGEEPRAVFDVPPALRQAPKGEFAHGATSPEEARAAREEHADVLAVAEERIRAGLVKQLGEDLGELAFATAAKNKRSFRRAVRAVAEGKFDVAQSILAPSAERYQVKVAEGVKPSSSGGAGSALPF